MLIWQYLETIVVSFPRLDIQLEYMDTINHEGRQKGNVVSGVFAYDDPEDGMVTSLVVSKFQMKKGCVFHSQ
jgi:hypothetical protein